MTSARSTQIDLNATAFYHCMTRCVRQSYLCGIDLETGRDYSHRKEWIVARIKKLAKIFAIRICAYAIMSNHYHLVLFIDEQQGQNWTQKEVKTRWGKLFPKDVNKHENSNFSEIIVQQKIQMWRGRLMSISWFMRCLNEPIARYSNLEDECMGRFWAGRFKSQALLDEGAVLSAMAYVDLNPIRAKMASTLENSSFTSIQERIVALKNSHSMQLKNKVVNTIRNQEHLKQPSFLLKFSTHLSKEQTPSPLDFKLLDYLQLVDETGKIIRNDKKGAISQKIVPILTRLNLSIEGWLTIATQLEEKFYSALGNEVALLKLANKNHRHSIRASKWLRHATFIPWLRKRTALISL